MMKDSVQRIGRFIIVDIHLPIYTNDAISGVAVNKKYLIEAKEYGRYLVVRTPTGEEIFTPNNLKKIKTFNKVFKYPDDPMKMVSLKIHHKEKKPREFYEATSIL